MVGEFFPTRSWDIIEHMKKRSVSKKVQEELAKYQKTKEKPQAEQPHLGKPLPKTSGAFAPRPDKKRG